MDMQSQANKPMQREFVPIVGRTRDGLTVWYTGRTGPGWVSPKAKEAFLGYGLEGARACAARLNRMTEVHGVYFVACVGDLAREVN